MDAHKFIKFIYERKTASLSELSAKAGVSHNSISRWNAGVSPRLIDLEAVLGVLGFELVIAKKHRPDFEPERDAVLVSEVKAILNSISPVTDNEGIARDIVVAIGSAYEGQTCLDLTDELVIQSRTIDHHISEVNRLTARIAELELSSGYRTGATDKIRAMAIGEVTHFPAGSKYTKLAKRIWNLAHAAGLKTKQRSIQKNGMIYVEVTRIA